MKISEYKTKVDHLRSRNDQLQSEISDFQRRDSEVGFHESV